MTRILIPCAALLWGLQFGFLNPTLAIILVALFDASTVEVGVVLSVYNAGGFLAALAIPAIADRRADYLRPMLLCGLLTIALVVLLSFTGSLPVAAVILFLLGGPASTGMALLFAHLRNSGATQRQVVNTRALFSAAWLVGPPAAVILIDIFGEQSILWAIGAIAVLTTTTVLLMTRDARVARDGVEGPVLEHHDRLVLPKRVVALIVVAFALLFAGSNSVTSVITLYVTQTVGLPAMWAGIALAVAVALEIPALVVIGRLASRFSSVALIASGCIVGVVYFLAMGLVTEPVLLLALQPLNAWRVAAVSGVGIALFQQMIRRPGIATGIFVNTQRVGAVLSGAIIAVGSSTVIGERGIFFLCAVLCVIALLVVLIVRKISAA